MGKAEIIQAWHNRLHSIISTLDHSSAATPGRILEADGNGLPIESANTDAELADAVVKRHTQNTDTNLGAVGVKNPPIDADKPLYRDSAAGDALVTSSWAQVKAFFKTYFDTLYGPLASAHARLHSITSALDHTSGATPGKMLKADANGLPVDASNTDIQVAATVALAHAKQHAITSAPDHTSAATPGKMLKADANGLPVDATNTDAEVSDAVAKRHTQGTDTTLGILTADVNFNRFKAIAMVCDNGATMPTAPVSGQWFLHTPTGRCILYQYYGSWIPHISMGSMTVYVDKTDGTDDLNHGTGVDANAFKTVQYAINCIPGLFGGNVAIYINGETYSESVTIRGKKSTGNYIITLSGTLSTLDTGTCTAGSVAGTGATQGTVIDDTGGWGVDAYANKLVKFTSGVNNGVYRVIDSNTADTLTIVGTWSGGAPSATDTFDIYDWATTITTFTIASDQFAIDVQKILFNAISVYPTTYMTAEYISLSTSGSNTWYGYEVIDTCYFYQSSTNNCVEAQTLGRLVANRSKFRNSNNSGSCFSAQNYGQAFFANGCIFDGYVDGVNKATYGMYLRTTYVQTYNAAAGGYNRVRNCDTGIYACNGAQVIGTANNQYSGNGTDENGVAASFGYID
jgi:hypothetical protein